MKKHTKYLFKKFKNNKIELDDLNHTLDLLKGLLNSKKELIKGECTSPDTGLCTYALDTYTMVKYSRRVFQTWEHYSGVKEYPLPVITGSDSPQSQYWCRNHYFGEVGKLRLKLAKHLVKTIEKDIKKLKRKGVLNVN